MEAVRQWVLAEKHTDGQGLTPTNTDVNASVTVGESPCSSVPVSALVANAALSLLNLCCHLLDRQLAAQAAAFEKEGDFTERLYRIRRQTRSRQS